MLKIFYSLSLIALLLLVANAGWAFYEAHDHAEATKLFERLQELRSRSQILRQGLGHSQTEAATTLENERAVCVQQLAVILRRSSIHFLYIVVTSLVCTLVSSVTITYFVGTSRWAREVVEAYGLETEFAIRGSRFKRCSFSWALLGICAVLVLATFAGAANSAVRLVEAADWQLHYQVVASLGVAVIAFSFHRQARYLSANYQLIQEIVMEVKRIRVEHGLQTSE
ncbi:MAG: hypothetical protein CMJ81_04545 [Planctomycetaceae bacterium]|nr:hypothetical protein [Planctomycetaceae bacterium]MBP63696.1 hypothetical protein [Planctomycetaceae bacterium]